MGFHGAEVAEKKILSTFLENLGKFVNKNGIKVVFGVGLCRNISKISKKMPILSKVSRYIYQEPPKYIYQGAGAPPQI